MVDGVLPGENDLRDGDKGVALPEQSLDDSRQGSGVWRAALWNRTMDPGCHGVQQRKVLVTQAV